MSSVPPVSAPQACRGLLAALQPFAQSHECFTLPNAAQEIEAVAARLLELFTQPGFKIPAELESEFVSHNHLISNLVALSSFKTTDAALQIIRTQPDSLARVLTLYSARNTVHFDRPAFFSASPPLASLWYVQFAELFHAGLVSKTLAANLRMHFEFATSQFLPLTNLQEPYFGSSYVEGPCERIIKPCINQAVQQITQTFRTGSTPRDPRKIAFCAAHWHSQLSPFRTSSQMIAALRPRFHLTALQIGTYSQFDTAGFDDHRVIPASRGLPDLRAVADNDFHMILYPDVGMSGDNIILANTRLAPIQLTMLGHSVSTFGAQIDYFVSGSAVEIPHHPEQHYSERLVLLPRTGVVHNKPLYTPKGFTPGADRIVINCPWQSHKLNHAGLHTLAAIARGARRPVLFRLFVGSGTHLYGDHIAFQAEIAAALPPGHFELCNLPYEDYMTLMEQAHFSLDAWHFGGCNTVSDSLYLRVPMLCREGDRWYNRIGPHMLRQVELPELIAQSEEQYIATALRLIQDDAWRDTIRARLKAADLDQTLYSDSDAKTFADAIEFIMRNHDSLRTRREPLRFPLTAAPHRAPPLP